MKLLTPNKIVFAYRGIGRRHCHYWQGDVDNEWTDIASNAICYENGLTFYEATGSTNDYRVKAIPTELVNHNILMGMTANGNING